MDKPRPEKVAVVEEVRQRLADSNASVVAEYRGLSVTQLAELRKNLAGLADFKIYKNTLVRIAVADGPHGDLVELLSGPSAITFVKGDVGAAAKALRDFARSHPSLIVKGGLSASGPLTSSDLGRLADLPSREVLLARLAGGLSAPLSQLGALLTALPRGLAYGLSALLEKRESEGGDRVVAQAAVDGQESQAQTDAEKPAEQWQAGQRT
ncbi:MAG: 50S ribosomal protein L10 [Acidimicrobiales bacterium]